MAANKLKQLKEELDTDYENPLVKKAVTDYMHTFDERDINFCDHDTAGIIPLVEGTTRNYKKMNPDAKIYQMVGMLHVLNGVIQDKLKKAEIPYVVLIPNKNEI